MSNAQLPGRDGSVVLADRPAQDIASHLLDRMFDKRTANLMRDDLQELGHSLTPQELAEIYLTILSETTEDDRASFANLAPMWSQLTNGKATVFSREKLFEGTTLYRSAVQGAIRPALICFTSRLNGLFMPNCRFLDLLGGFPVDVVINKTESGSFGEWDLSGTGSFSGSLAVLGRTLAERGIRAGVYVGASSGGGPAVYAATFDPRVSAVVFGCRFFGPGRNIPLREAGTAFEPICACWQRPPPRVYNIYGAAQRIDVANDERLRALIPGTRSYPMPGDDKHNPMVTLRARRKLRYVLDLLIQVSLGQTVDFDQVTKP